MNEDDLVDAELHDDTEGNGDVVAAEVTTPVATATDEVATATDEVATATDEPTAEVTTPVAAVVKKARSGAGRKVDTTGTTALGSARLLYAANPGLGTKELRALFVEKLGPKFGTTDSVAQTYVSLVRKPKKSV